MPIATKTSIEIEIGDISGFRPSNGPRPRPDLDPRPALEPSEAVTKFPVALVTMPFAHVTEPSLQLGLLKAIARRAGFPADDYYLNMDLVPQLGYALYEEFEGMPSAGLAGEWLFSVAAFGDEANRADYFAAFPEELERMRQAGAGDVAYFDKLREHIIPEYIDACLNRFDWGAYKVVGFASSQQQHVASLALARRIKDRFPRVAIVFFGKNMDGKMGLEHVRAFPYIDYAICGENDDVFPELLTRLAHGCATEDMLGVVTRRGDRVAFVGPARPVDDMNGLPIPDYDTYFEVAPRYGVDKYVDSIADPLLRRQFTCIPIESSRGCWWGEKSHCTFCGCIGTSMAYRSKSPERMLAEIDELSKRYSRKVFSAQDFILDMKYIEGMFDPLAERGDDYQFFFCVKANLSKEQVRRLADGGLRIALPGIDSLNTHVLTLMRKGVTRLQNVNLLRWATYYGIHAVYSILHGFPGERREDYEEQLATFRLISHLEPPMSYVPIRLERFSPNFNDEHLFPTTWRRPTADYSYVYPPRVDLDQIAYYFDHDSAANAVPDSTHREVQAVVAHWQQLWHSGRQNTIDSQPGHRLSGFWCSDQAVPRMIYRRAECDILIDDTRFGANQSKTYTLIGPDADVYEACSAAPRTPAQICDMLRSECPGFRPDSDSITEACVAFCEAGLMLGENGKYLSLAIPGDVAGKGNLECPIQ